MTEHVNLHSFQDLQKDWEQLLQFSSTDTLFLHPAWQRVWWETIGFNSTLKLLSISIEGKILGIAPLVQRENEISFLGGTDLFDYHDFIIQHDREKQFFQILMGYLDTENWREINLASLPQNSPTLNYLPEIASTWGWDCKITEEDVSPGIYLPKDWESYLSILTKKDRHELRRKFRRLYSSVNPYHNACSDPQEIDSCLDDLFNLMRLSHEEKRGFLTPERETFFRAISKEMAASDHLRLYFMEIDGTKAASVLCFDYKGKRYLYNSGFNPIHSRFSVGLLMKAIALEEAISNGFGYFDFLRGSENYKYDLGGTDTQIYSLSLYR